MSPDDHRRLVDLDRADSSPSFITVAARSDIVTVHRDEWINDVSPSSADEEAP